MARNGMIYVRTKEKTAVTGWIILFVFVTYFISFLFIFPQSVSADRIKNIANFEGVRSNQLIGYGLVMGLPGTGDTGLATAQGIANILQRMGLTVNPNDIKTKDVAAVMVTALLPPFPKPGVRVDALVSALGDAKSLQGGTLLLSPLKGPDGKVYALAQGPVSIGGFIGGSGGNSTTMYPTALSWKSSLILHLVMGMTSGCFSTGLTLPPLLQSFRRLTKHWPLSMLLQ